MVSTATKNNAPENADGSNGHEKKRATPTANETTNHAPIEDIYIDKAILFRARFA